MNLCKSLFGNLSCRKLCLLLLFQLLLIGTLVPTSDAFNFFGLFGGGAKGAKKLKKKGRPDVTTLNHKSFFKKLEAYKQSDELELSVVLVYIPSNVEDFLPAFRDCAKRFKKDKTFHFYRTDLVQGGEFLEIKQFGPKVEFESLTSKSWRIFLVKNGDLEKPYELYTATPWGELDPDVLETELKARRSKHYYYEIQPGDTWEGFANPHKYGTTVVAYFSSKWSIGFKAFDMIASKIANSLPLSPTMMFYYAENQDFIKSFKSDVDLKDGSIFVYRKADQMVEIIPPMRNPKALAAKLTHACIPQFIDMTTRKFQEDFATSPFIAENIKNDYQANRYRLEVIAPPEEWTRVKEIVREAMQFSIDNKHFTRHVHLYPRTQLINTFAELVFKTKNDTSEIMIGATHNIKRGRKDSDLLWKADLENNTLTVDYIQGWMKSVGFHELTPFSDPTYGVVSERIPKFDTGIVKKVVGFNFDEFVNSGKNVLIYFFAKANEESVAFSTNELKDIAKAYAGQDDLTFAKINGPKNKIQDDRFKLDTYPKIFFINTDMEVVEYEGLHLKEDIIKFVDAKRTKIFTRDDSLAEEATKSKPKEGEEDKSEL